MFEKYKAKRALYKAYKLYEEKKMPYLTVDTNLYQQLQDICYAIAYVLCEYFDFNYEFYHNYWGYKYDIAYNYIYHSERGKQYLEEFIKRKEDDDDMVDWDWDADVFKDLSEDSIPSYMTDNNNNLYYWNGKNL